MHHHTCPNCKAIWSAGLVLDRPTCRVQWPGAETRLTSTEFEILALILARPRTGDGRVTALYGWRTLEDPIVCLRVIVSRLRKKLSTAGFPGEIVTKRGPGASTYSLALSAPNATPPQALELAL